MAPNVLNTADDVTKPPPLQTKQKEPRVPTPPPKERAPTPPPKDSTTLPTSSSDTIRVNQTVPAPRPLDFTTLPGPSSGSSGGASRQPPPLPPKNSAAPVDRPASSFPGFCPAPSVHASDRRSSTSSNAFLESQRRARQDFFSQNRNSQPTLPRPSPSEPETTSRRKALLKWFGFKRDSSTSDQGHAPRNTSAASSSVATDSDPRQDSFWRRLSIISKRRKSSARPTTATTFGFRPQGDLKGTVDTLGNEVSPSEAERARESSQVPSRIESVENHSTRAPLLDPQDQHQEDDPDKITPAPPGFTNPPYPDEQDLPQSSSAELPESQPQGHQGTEKVDGAGASEMDSTGQPSSTDAARAGVHNDEARVPSLVQSRDVSLEERERGHMEFLHRNIIMEIHHAQARMKAGKIVRTNAVRNSVDAPPLCASDTSLTVEEERECVKNAFIRAHLYDRIHNGWNGRFLGRRKWGEKRHFKKYAKHNKWIRHDWACGTFETPQFALPGHPNW